MNEAKVNDIVEKIFKAWDLEGAVLDDEAFVRDIYSAIREAYIKGYKKGIGKVQKQIKKINMLIF
jgi:hypothetical protein